MLIDLHCHSSERSDDASASITKLAASAKSAGLDGICITDHDTFWPEETVKEISDSSGILVIPGCEINTDSGHALVFGLREYKFGFHHPKKLADAVYASGGALIAAHPYRRTIPKGSSPGELKFINAVSDSLKNPLFKYCVAIETFNGRGTATENFFSSELAVLAGLPGVGSSDAHHSSDIGRAATWFQRPVKSLTDLVDELHAGRFSVWESKRWPRRYEHEN